MPLDASCNCAMNNVEAGESLPGARHARKEHQESFLLLACCFNNCYETCCCGRQVVGVCISNAPDVVTREDGRGGVDDIRDGPIGRSVPVFAIEHCVAF